MAKESDLFFALFNNLTIFIALMSLYGLFLRKFSTAGPLKRQIILGISFSLFALGSMCTKTLVHGGLMVDQRNTIIAISGAFGGPLSAMITAVSAGIYRACIGGSGVVLGLAAIGLSAIAGIILNRRPASFSSMKHAATSSSLTVLLTFFGILVTGDMQTALQFAKALILPYSLSTFCGIFLLGLLLKKEENSFALEKHFRANKERLDLALEGSDEGLWDFDIKNRTLHFDERYYTISGYQPGDFPETVEEWEKRVHPDDIAATKRSIGGYLSGRLKNHRVEYRFLQKNGEYMWLQEKGKIVARDTNGAPTRFIGTHFDITERKKQEQAQIFSQFSFDRAAMPIMILRQDGGIENANRQAVTDLGYTIKELHRMSISDIDLPITPEIWREKWEHLYHQRIITIESVHKRKDGSQFPVEVTAHLLEHDGQHYSMGFIADISQRKQSESELQSLRNYLSNIINSMPSVLIGVDLNLNVTQWNTQAETLTGISVHDALGKPFDQVFPWLYTQRGTIQKSMATLKTERTSKLPYHDPGGELHYQDITIYPLTADHIGGTVIRIDDVTEKVRLEEMLIQNEKMLSIGGLAAGMAHEINNPLAGVIQNISALENRLTDTTIPANISAARLHGITMEAILAFMETRQIPRMLSVIKEAGSRMAGIVTNMLSFARKSDASFSSYDPVQLLDNVLELATTDYDLKKQYDFKFIDIKKEYEPDLPMILCEGNKIQQVLLNILKNGSHAMFARKNQPDAPQPRFILRLSQKENMIRIEIEDNGIGMDPATRKKIFEPFYTTKPAGTGTGLGLSISCFIITENHNGTLQVTSTPGQGSNFIICLPVA